jgi:CubicO group peptidase (beta-lactamase class C family)
MFGFGKQSRSSWITRNRPSAPIAADFGRSSVRLLQLAAGATEYRCTAAAEIPGSPFEGNGHKLDSQVLASRIHDAIRGLGFGGQRVYIVPSRNLVIVRTGVSSTDWMTRVYPMR